MKVVIKRALKVLLGEKRATHLFFMTRRGIRNLEITKFVIKIAYGKYIGGGGQTPCKNQSSQQPQHNSQIQYDKESHKIIHNILYSRQKRISTPTINHSSTNPPDNTPDNKSNDKQTSPKDTLNLENDKHIKTKSNTTENNPSNHPPLVVSITSFPARISYLHHTLFSIFQQNYKHFKVAVFLSEEEFPTHNLPYILRIFAKLDLITIHFVQENLRAYKKLFYTIDLYPQHLIITIDDDQMYDPSLISLLLTSYKKYPNCIHANMVYDDLIADMLNVPFSKYQPIIKEDCPHLALAGVGVSGILYPPKSFPNEFFNIENIRQLCPYSDDLWFFVMSVLNGVEKVLIKGSLDHPKESSVAITETPNLWEINCTQKRNYDQLEALFKAYPSAKERLLESLAYN
ncbi:hypothetical protein HRAG_00119 [Helicobacter bilis ATCC 43879]|uniref:Glycosyltransferase 2-like domain-containing protein n=1 Tax=Helicobacter bilis ATCC 43879 TaxID=613026 RepID=C3XDH3_9HELI|nr:glycosyltransferase family 2 protein [Helicobacter bilis]EEO23062.1 hypothetical protein HRAG_00119 [Helicobacter bilis ATCC 43879]